MPTTTAVATCQAPPIWPLVHHHRARRLLTHDLHRFAWPKPGSAALPRPCRRPFIYNERAAGHLSTTTAVATCQAPPTWPLVHHHSARHLLTTTLPRFAWPEQGSAALPRRCALPVIFPCSGSWPLVHHHRGRYLPSTAHLATCPPPPRASHANRYCASLCESFRLQKVMFLIIALNAISFTRTLILFAFI